MPSSPSPPLDRWLCPACHRKFRSDAAGPLACPNCHEPLKRLIPPKKPTIGQRIVKRLRASTSKLRKESASRIAKAPPTPPAGAQLLDEVSAMKSTEEDVTRIEQNIRPTGYLRTSIDMLFFVPAGVLIVMGCVLASTREATSGLFAFMAAMTLIICRGLSRVCEEVALVAYRLRRLDRNRDQ